MANPPTDYVALPNSERNVRAGATLRGPADPNETLTVSVRVRRRPDGPPLPEVPEPGQRGLSRGEFADRYGASVEDLDQVASFGLEHGLRVVDRSVARRTVVLAGTVEQVSRTFAVDLGAYESDEESYRGREGPIYIPANLSPIVEGVFGLDNRGMAHRAVLRQREKVIRAPSLAPVVVPLTPPRVARLYDFPS